jgi:hypothetical protein
MERTISCATRAHVNVIVVRKIACVYHLLEFWKFVQQIKLEGYKDDALNSFQITGLDLAHEKLFL